MLSVERPVLQAHQQRESPPEDNRHEVGAGDFADGGQLHGVILLRVEGPFYTQHPEKEARLLLSAD